MPVVSFRISDKEARRLEAARINAGLLAKELVLKELRKRSVEETLSFLAQNSIKPEKPVEQILRDMRESR